VGYRAEVLAAGQGRYPRSRLRRSCRRHGDRAGSVLGPLALAESVCRAPDRLDSARVPRARDHHQREATSRGCFPKPHSWGAAPAAGASCGRSSRRSSGISGCRAQRPPSHSLVTAYGSRRWIFFPHECRRMSAGRERTSPPKAAPWRRLRSMARPPDPRLETWAGRTGEADADAVPCAPRRGSVLTKASRELSASHTRRA